MSPAVAAASTPLVAPAPATDGGAAASYSFSQPELPEEEAHAFVLPKYMLCDACYALVRQLTA